MSIYRLHGVNRFAGWVELTATPRVKDRISDVVKRYQENSKQNDSAIADIFDLLCWCEQREQINDLQLVLTMASAFVAISEARKGIMF